MTTSRPPDPPARRTVSVRTLAFIVASAMFMEQMDSTVLTTALPTMAHSLHTDPLHLSVSMKPNAGNALSGHRLRLPPSHLPSP